eukprot:8787022-Alexandrium_andersonii.AAC.1
MWPPIPSGSTAAPPARSARPPCPAKVGGVPPEGALHRGPPAPIHVDPRPGAPRGLGHPGTQPHDNPQSVRAV